MFLVAHRGFRGPGRENRMIDFIDALKSCKGVEFDIRLTKDKKIIIFHDHNLKRIGNVNKTVKSMTFEEIKNIDFFKNNPENIPPLFVEDFINKISNKYEFINVEIKPNKNTKEEFELIKKALELLRKKTKAEIVVSSFGNEALKFISELDVNKFKKGYLTEYVKKVDFSLIRKFDYLHPYVGNLKSHDSLKYVEKINLPINVWTFKNDKDAEIIYFKYRKYLNSLISDKKDLRINFK
ncbi:glycerophosphoryl diester phosphodiesterase [Mesoplasma entomophilum]|uniref:Glycerophosphodiester phosphodiesterase n=1 Tax=Mesoplasma entomophilum TaxID=2149 RepID=A0A3S5Y0F2_9MOLU|nr:glycerophosphodiester phosphodiesterase family protein [Mesoplasma entomophilum]ATQ35792.1 glycerophosphodiester phosphodiesterase [Mesoplasma entomophilum]ATZ19762.1 glycerophosphoryl diester phosphodiesterase [Mesoplasma entomophilum]